MQNTQKDDAVIPRMLEEQYAHYFGNLGNDASNTGYFQMPTAYSDLRPVITTSALG